MDNENINIEYFPYEFKNIAPDEQKLVKKIFIPSCQFVRIGPKGYMGQVPYINDARNIYKMPLRPTDIFVASYQRSGTTWTQELVWLLATDLDYATALEVPLRQRYVFLDGFQFIDSTNLDVGMKSVDVDSNMSAKFTSLGQTGTRKLETMASPRFIKTHIPMSLLNPKLLDNAKLVYIARDPRDVAVSCYYHAKFTKILPTSRNFKEFWDMFYRGLFTFCPIFEHVKEAWALRYHPNMLFLFYEELIEDLPTCIRRVAKFLNKEPNEDHILRLCDHLSFDNFKKNKSVNLEDVNTSPSESFIRKGKIGGWRDYFDDEMTQQAEKWIKDGLSNTDLQYPTL